MAKAALKSAHVRSMERQELASAIDRAEKAATEVGRLQSVVIAAQMEASTAIDKLREARATLSGARTAQAEVYEAALEQGHPPPRDDAVQDAIRREAEAQEHANAANAALSSLQDKLADAELGVEKAREAITAAVRSVLDVAMETFLEETERLQTELVERRTILQFVNQASLPKWGSSPGNRDDIRDRIRNFTDLNVPRADYSSHYLDSSYPEILPWRDAIAALQCDPNAPLPETQT